MKSVPNDPTRKGHDPRRLARAGVRAALAALNLTLCGPLRAQGPTAPGPRVPSRSSYLNVAVSDNHEALLFLGVDGLGRSKVGQNVLLAQPPAAPANPGWRVDAGDREIRLASTA